MFDKNALIRFRDLVEKEQENVNGMLVKNEFHYERLEPANVKLAGFFLMCPGCISDDIIGKSDAVILFHGYRYLRFESSLTLTRN